MCVQYYEKMKAAELKPILGIQIKVFGGDEEGYVAIYAKNKAGWQTLLKILHIANSPETFTDGPRIDVYEFIQNITENIIVVWKNHFLDIFQQHVEPSPNIFVGLDPVSYPESLDVLRVLPHTKVAISPSHYLEPSDWNINKYLFANYLKTTIKEATHPLFSNNIYHVFGEVDFLQAGLTQEEVNNNGLVYEQVENFDILYKQKFPSYPCPNGQSEDDYLRDLCRKGWKEKGLPKEGYIERIKYELEEISYSGMSGYFLIMQDVIKWAKANNIFVGTGRGCVAGDTDIFTESGLKKIKDINIGDKVYSKDGKLHVVQDTHCYEVNEDLVLLTRYYNNQPLALTKDHKILVSKTPDESKLSWIEANYVEPNDYVFFPNIKDINVQLQYNWLDLKEYVDSNDYEWRDEEVLIHTFGGHRREQYIGSKIHARYIKLDSHFFKVLGIFTGDGCLKKPPGNRYVIISAKTKKESFDIVTKWCHRYNFEYSVYDGIIYIRSRIISDLFHKLFHLYKNSCSTKHIPQLVKNAPHYLIHHYLYGYKITDGTQSSKNLYKITTTSKLIVSDLINLLYRLNIKFTNEYTVNFDKRTGKEYIRYVIGVNSAENDNFVKTENGYMCKIRKVGYTNQENKVFDLTVDGEHNYLTLNGIVHNSGGGCLTAFLTDITAVDPIKYGLLFERFYSRYRGSVVDLDTDLPPSRREDVVRYIQEKYGSDNFAQICTFNTLKGAAGLKTVLRATGLDASEQNFITKKIPQEGKIAPELKQQKDEIGSDSIVLWCIRNMKEFEQWCTSNFDGVYASEFQVAIELDKLIQGRGRHASAYALSDEEIYKKAPLIWDKSARRYVVGVNMDDAEKLGLVKLDLLGLDLLDKADFIRRRLKNGAF